MTTLKTNFFCCHFLINLQNVSPSCTYYFVSRVTTDLSCTNFPVQCIISLFNKLQFLSSNDVYRIRVGRSSSTVGQLLIKHWTVSAADLFHSSHLLVYHAACLCPRVLRSISLIPHSTAIWPWPCANYNYGSY